MPYDFAWEIQDAAADADLYDDRPTAADFDDYDGADYDPDADYCGCSDRLCPCDKR